MLAELSLRVSCKGPEGRAVCLNLLKCLKSVEFDIHSHALQIATIRSASWPISYLGAVIVAGFCLAIGPGLPWPVLFNF